MTAKILLLGKGGQVGAALLPLLGKICDVVAPDRAIADLSRPDSLSDIVEEVAPDLIVNAAAYTAVDKAESDRDLAFLVNRDAPGALARAAARRGALLIHYSTDYVFSGERSADAPAYREDEQTGPLGVYGQSKRAGEVAVAAAQGDHIILRTAWVYAENGANFVKTIRRLLHEREILRVVDDQIGAPTWARDIAGVTAAIAERHIDGRAGPLGLFHLTSHGRTSWHGFARAIWEAERDRRPSVATRTIEPIATSAYPTPAKRPAFSVLDSERIHQAYGLAVGDWQSRFQAFLASETASTGSGRAGAPGV